MERLQLVHESTYLINGVRFVVVHDPEFAGLSMINHRRILDVDDILYRKRDLDAVAFVVGTEDATLNSLDPLLGTRGAVGLEVKSAFMRDDFEA